MKKAILMAAGRGTRISRYIGDMPKCVLDIGGQPLVRYVVEMLLNNNIEIAIVVGYKKEMVIKALEGLSVSYYYNPFYDVTNSIASLWFAKEVFNGEDILLANADVFWEEDILSILKAEKRDPVMLVDSSRKDDGDYFFKFEGDKLLKHGKDLKRKDISGEYVGIAKIGGVFQHKFVERLETLINNQEHYLWWENVLYSFIGEESIYVKDIKGNFWSEIDYIEDYNRIINYRKSKVDELG